MRYTREYRIEHAQQALDEGRIIQKMWRSSDARGRELVCALAAFGPDINDDDDCPSDFMPPWLAALVPSLDDGIAESDIPILAGGLIQRARLWHQLDDAAWERIRPHIERCWVNIMGVFRSRVEKEQAMLGLIHKLFHEIDKELNA